MMKTKPDNKIIIHWILITALLGVLLYYIENKSILYLTGSLIILSLIFNRITYLKLKADSILITKNNFLFVPTYKFLINLNDITRLSLIDYRDIEINNSRKYSEFEAVVIVEAITGTLFYKPNFILVIDLIPNKRVEFEINADRKSMLKLITVLQKQIHEHKNKSYGI
ncbi:MAG: hypothetical protein R6V23_14005 [Bacteroidales bacterium]